MIYKALASVILCLSAVLITNMVQDQCAALFMILGGLAIIWNDSFIDKFFKFIKDMTE